MKMTKTRRLQVGQSPFESRTYLRRSLAQWLPSSPRIAHRSAEEFRLEDSLAVELCTTYDLLYEGSEDSFQPTWEARLKEAGEGDFAGLIESGLLIFDAYRWRGARFMSLARRHLPQPGMVARALIAETFKLRVVQRPGTSPSSALQALVERMQADGLQPNQFWCYSSSWVSARSWERILSETVDLDSLDRGYCRWAEWVMAIGLYLPDGTQALSHEAFGQLRAAAERALELPGLYKSAIEINELLKVDAQAAANRKFWIDLVPHAAVSRLGWLKRFDIEEFAATEIISSSIAKLSLTLLREFVGAADAVLMPFKLAEKVLEHLAERPGALGAFEWQLKHEHRLLGDMLMFPKTTCLAIRLILETHLEGAPSEGRLLESRLREAKTFVLDDALAVLNHHLDHETLPPIELSALLARCTEYEVQRVRQSDEDSLGRWLRNELLKRLNEQSPAVQSAVVAELAKIAVATRAFGDTGRTVFEALASLEGVSATLGAAVVEHYIANLLNPAQSVGEVAALSDAARVKLVVAALSNPVLFHRFMKPIDFKAAIENDMRDGGLPGHRAAAPLRTHVRLLARAIGAWPEPNVPQELTAGFIELVRLTSATSPTDGRIGALTGGFEFLSFFTKEPGVLGEDIARAWSKLPTKDLKALKAALSSTTDPKLLATVAQFLPEADKTSLDSAIRRMTPPRSAEVWTITELEARVTSLIEVGQFKLARSHLQRTVKSWDSPRPHHLVVIFGLNLRIMMECEEWAKLDKAKVPPVLDDGHKQDAQRHLDFYQATSLMVRVNGDLDKAVRLLDKLRNDHPKVGTYTNNWIAALVRRLVGPDDRKVPDKLKEKGQELVVLIERELEHNRVLSASDRVNIRDNLFALVLCLQEPQRVLDAVDDLGPSTDLSAETYAAIALHDLDRPVVALDRIEHAIAKFGSTERARSVHATLKAHFTPTPLPAEVQKTDARENHRQAFSSLVGMTSSAQMEAVRASNQDAKQYLLWQIGLSLSAIEHVAPLIRPSRGAADKKKLENDVNEFLARLLAERFSYLKWSTHSQSPGGVTAAGNLGARDVTLRCGHDTQLVVCEALVCKSVEEQRVIDHFVKLFAYGDAELLVHVVYSYASRAQKLSDFIEQMAKTDTPPGVRYLAHRPLQKSECLLPGFIATYSMGHRVVSMAFLILDLGQAAARKVIGAAPA